jgi:hypothetical protein
MENKSELMGSIKENRTMRTMNSNSRARPRENHAKLVSEFEARFRVKSRYCLRWVVTETAGPTIRSSKRSFAGIEKVRLLSFGLTQSPEE